MNLNFDPTHNGLLETETKCEAKVGRTRYIKFKCESATEKFVTINMLYGSVNEITFYSYNLMFL